jgi:hypothetical protein
MQQVKKIWITGSKALWVTIESLWQEHLSMPHSPISFNNFLVLVLEKGVESLKKR